MNDDNHVTGHDEIRQRQPRDDAVAAETDADRGADGDGDAQSPDVDGAAGHIVRFHRDREQRRLGDRGRECDRQREHVDPEIRGPVIRA